MLKEGRKRGATADTDDEVPLTSPRLPPFYWAPFTLSGDWGAADCQVQAVEPNRTLSYTWSAMGLESVVTWTLTPTSTGTQLRMEQVGFRPDQQQAYHGARFGWQKFFAAMEQVLAGLD